MALDIGKSRLEEMSNKESVFLHVLRLRSILRY